MIETVAENSKFVLLYKPAGVPVESRDVTVPDLCHALKGRAGGISVINRLDQPVEGLVLFAKDKRSAAHLSGQMQTGQIEKEYLCVVHGRPAPDRGRLEGWLKKSSAGNFSAAARAGEAGAKQAILFYEVLNSRELEKESY